MLVLINMLGFLVKNYNQAFAKATHVLHQITGISMFFEKSLTHPSFDSLTHSSFARFLDS